MHSKEHQTILESMTRQEKLRRTRIQECKKRTSVKEYKYWFIIQNEYPHIDREGEQYVLYEKRLGDQTQDKWHELEGIFSEYVDWHIHRNPKKGMSVPGRLHFHIYK